MLELQTFEPGDLGQRSFGRGMALGGGIVKGGGIVDGGWGGGGVDAVFGEEEEGAYSVCVCVCVGVHIFGSFG